TATPCSFAFVLGELLTEVRLNGDLYFMGFPWNKASASRSAGSAGLESRFSSTCFKTSSSGSESSATQFKSGLNESIFSNVTRRENPCPCFFIILSQAPANILQTPFEVPGSTLD